MGDNPNICKGSSENDKHALAIAPVPVPRMIATALTSTHDFVFMGGLLTDNGVDSPLSWTSVGAGSHIQEILTVNLNNPFLPIHNMWLNRDSLGLSGNMANVFSRYAAPYYPQGVNLYRSQFQYYKVEKSEWVIDFLNYQGFDGENPTVPVTIHSYHQNNEANIPTLSSPSGGGASSTTTMADVATFLMNPRAGTICGGQPLGTCSVAGYSGLASETVVFPYAPELRTSFTYSSNNSVASDPGAVTNIQYWTTLTGPGTPANINRMHFAIIPHMGANFGNAAHLRPIIKIRARFTIAWRDHAANDSIFTALNT